jgi:hypothetical protein
MTDCARGPTEVWRRGEDPRAVFIGERDRGGGRVVRLLRRMCVEVVRPGIEPAVANQSAWCPRYSLLRAICESWVSTYFLVVP